MGNKQKPVANDASSNGASVVVFKTSRFADSRLVKWWRAMNPELRIGLVLLVLIAGCLVAYFLLHNPAAEPKTPLPPGIDTDYSSTELTNYPILLDHDYGLTEDGIMHGNLHKQLKTFQEAYDVAVAIARLGDRHRSLDAYKIAVSKAPQNTSQDFYVEVMGIAYQMGDPQYGDQMYQKARTVIEHSNLPENDPSAPSDKQRALGHLQGLYELAKQGANR
jgi:hypothetical protein